MDCDGADCDGCAVCDTLVMSSSNDWKPTWLPIGTMGRCIFCQRNGQLAYYGRLGHSIGLCCASK